MNQIDEEQILTGCIDRLELRVPATLVRDRVIMEIRKMASPHRNGNAYTCELDCRKAGINARLHYRSLFAKDRHHKIELLQVGKINFRQMLEQVAKLTAAAPKELTVMRLDLASDVEGYSVEWFKLAARVCRKHFFREITSNVSSGSGITLQFGRRPDCVRIYDKMAELQYRYQKLQRRSGVASSFEVWAGRKRYQTLTRVERQYARTLPPILRTLDDLPQVIHLKPFSVLVFLPTGHPPQSPDQFSLHEWITGTWLRENVDRNGYAATRAFVNRWGRNFHRFERRYRSFLNNYNPPDLNALFVAGAKQQLGL